MPLKLPICAFDAKTGILCANCEARLKRGEIGKADVEASKALVAVAEKSQELGKVRLSRAFESGGNYLLEVDRPDVLSFRSSEGAAQALETALGGKVWVVATGGSDRGFLEDVFYPAKVLTVNTVWLPDGEKRTKVIVPGRRSERHYGDFESLREVVRAARGIELLVETEREAVLRPRY